MIKDGDLSKEREKEAKTSLAQIPRPPPLFQHKMKKKAEDSKFSKFMDMLKQWSIMLLW